jgi:hypothetical protein
MTFIAVLVSILLVKVTFLSRISSLVDEFLFLARVACKHLNFYATLYGSDQLVHGQRWYSAGTVKRKGTWAELDVGDTYCK